MLDQVLEFLRENLYLSCGIVAVVFLLIVIILLPKKKNKVEEPVVEEPVVEEPVVEEQLVEQPIVVEEAVQEPVVEEPVVQEEVTEVEQEKVEEPVVELEEEIEEVVFDEEAPEDEVEQEEVEEPVVEEPVVQEEVVEEKEPVQEPVAEQQPKPKRTRKPKVEKEESVEEKGETNMAKKVTEPTKKVEEKPTVERVVKGKYEILFDGREYQYVLKASNGEVLVESEFYTTKESVLTAIETVIKNVETGTIRINKDKRDLYQFFLVAKNHRVLVTSANYSSEKDCIRASNSFKRFALISPVVEVEEIVASREFITITPTEPKKGGKIIILKDDESYYFQLKANNGEVLCMSPAYKTKEGVLGGLDNLKAAVKEGRFYVYKDKRGYYQFKLYSKANRHVINGETYPTKQQAISSANSVSYFIDLAEMK